MHPLVAADPHSPRICPAVFLTAVMHAIYDNTRCYAVLL